MFSRMTTKSWLTPPSSVPPEERPVVDVEVELEPHLEQQASFDEPGARRGADRTGVEGVDPRTRR